MDSHVTVVRARTTASSRSSVAGAWASYTKPRTHGFIALSHLKFLLQEVARDPQSLARFQREAQAASANIFVPSRGLAKVLDFGLVKVSVKPGTGLLTFATSTQAQAASVPVGRKNAAVPVMTAFSVTPTSLSTL